MRLVFAGTPEFAAASLDALLAAGHDVCGVLTQPDRPAGRGRKPRPSPVKQRALDHGLELAQPTTLKGTSEDAEGGRSWLAARAPHAMIVAAYGLLLPASVLTLPTAGCINVHASLLPRWRGAAPIQRAILAGDASTGVCIMQMETGLDTGPVLARAETPIGSTENAGQLHDRLAQLGAKLLVDTLGDLDRSAASAEPQPEAGATYARRLDKAESRIDWCADSAAIERQVRAFNPWPTAFTELDDGRRLRVLEVARDVQAPAAAPATLDGDDWPRVATGDGWLRLAKVQLAGGKPVAGDAFWRGVRGAARLA